MIELARRARERRDHILQKFTTLDRLSEPADKLSEPADRLSNLLSNPAFHTTLPFPFVGSVLPKRFKIYLENDEKNVVLHGKREIYSILKQASGGGVALQS